MSEKRHQEIGPGTSEMWENFAAVGRELADFFLGLGDHDAAGHASDDAFLAERRAHEARKRG